MTLLNYSTKNPYRRHRSVRSQTVYLNENDLQKHTGIIKEKVGLILDMS